MESACKPGSVEDDHSSGIAVTGDFKRPTRKHGGTPAALSGDFPIWPCSRWGLPCRPCYHVRGALLPHRFTLASPVAGASAVCFLLHFPSPRDARPLAGTLPCGARTFLDARTRRDPHSPPHLDCQTVPRRGLEPPRRLRHQILSLACLPVSAPGQFPSSPAQAAGPATSVLPRGLEPPRAFAH